MPLRKTAIAVDAKLLASVDRMARERGESRSAFISTVLRRVARARGDEEITRRVRAIFADPRIAEEQVRTATEMGEAGTDWGDERW